MEKDLITQSLDILKDFRDTQCSGVTRKAAEALGMNPDGGLLAKWLAGTRVPSMTTLAPILAKLGAKIVLPNEQNESTPVIHRLKPYAPIEKVDGEELPTIPVLAYAGAGNPGGNFLRQQAWPDAFLSFLNTRCRISQPYK